MNINSLVQDSLGREIFSFGGQRTSWRTETYRGYYCSLEWFIGSKTTEPMLCIQNANTPNGGMLGICLSSIGKYADESGGASANALKYCRAALETLGKADLVIETKTLLDVILHFASDLIKMPPAPLAVRKEEVRAALIEVELKDESSGKVQREISI